MPRDRGSFRDFRHRLRGREHLLGTFIKTPTTHATEIFGLLGFDFVVFDQEHAPLGREALDVMILGSRAANVAGIVRVGDPSEANILSVLDCGATGVLVPHVDTAEKARAIAGACRYRRGRRGFANTTRAGQFGGLSFAEHMDRQDSEICCVAMIEDLSALDQIDSIVRVEGIDAIFIDWIPVLPSGSPSAQRTQRRQNRRFACRDFAGGNSDAHVLSKRLRELLERRHRREPHEAVIA